MSIFETRPPEPKDKNFFLSTWIKSYRKTEDNKRMINQVYFDNTSIEVEQRVDTCNFIVAVNPEDHNHIFAYIAYTTIDDVLVIHYAYTKYSYRRYGIFNELLGIILPNPKNPIICTYATGYFDCLREKYNLMYNPFMKGTK